MVHGEPAYAHIISAHCAGNTDAVNVMEKFFMRQHYPFWLAGRTGSILNKREVVGFNLGKTEPVMRYGIAEDLVIQDKALHQVRIVHEAARYCLNFFVCNKKF